MTWTFLKTLQITTEQVVHASCQKKQLLFLCQKRWRQENGTSSDIQLYLTLFMLNKTSLGVISVEYYQENFRIYSVGFANNLSAASMKHSWHFAKWFDRMFLKCLPWWSKREKQRTVFLCSAKCYFQKQEGRVVPFKWKAVLLWSSKSASCFFTEIASFQEHCKDCLLHRSKYSCLEVQFQENYPRQARMKAMTLLHQLPVDESTFCMRRKRCKQLVDQFDMNAMLVSLKEQTLWSERH